MGFVLFICIPVVLIALWGTGRWVLGPFAEAARLLRAPTRFFLSDFVWLLVLLQASFATARLVLDQEGSFWVILIFLVVASIAIWAGAVSALSRAGICQTLRRGIFTLVLLPAVLLLMGAVVMCLSAMITIPASVLFTRRLHGNHFDSVMHALTIWLFVLLISTPLIVGVAWVLRRLTRWIVAGIPLPDVAETERRSETKQ